jgi:tetratricopeptide (TPR) repeat protein
MTLSFKEQVLDATRALRDNDYDKAIAIYKKGLAENEKETALAKGIAQCYGWKGDLDSAMEYADMVLALEPNDHEMLMLSARYWSDKEDLDMTYKFVCRILENPPEQIEKVSRWVFGVIKPLSLVLKNFRGIEEKSKRAFEDAKRKREARLKWARDFKEWYERSLGLHKPG